MPLPPEATGDSVSKTIEKAIQVYEELWQLRDHDKRDWSKIDALEKQVSELWQAASKPYHALFGRQAAAMGTFVGPGWWEPLLAMLEDMTKIPDFVGNFEIVQIKEKFGGLRCYFSRISDEQTPEKEAASIAARALVHRAEALCEVRCERCGDPGETRTGGWVKTACARHA